MSDQDQVFWMGKPLVDYDKEQLIEIVRTLALRIAEFQTPEFAKALADAQVRQMQRG